MKMKAMRANVYFGFVLALLLAVSGCGPTSIIYATKDSSHTNEMKRLFVAEDLGTNHLGEYHQSYRRNFTQRLGECGVAVEFFSLAKPDPLALDDSRARAQQREEGAAIGKFGPDAVMQVSEVFLKTDGPLRRPVVVEYGVRLLDASNAKPFWQAEMTLGLNMTDFGDPGVVLADDLVTKWKKDGVLKSCPVGSH